MLAACLGANAEPGLQVGHCYGEVRHGVNDVVNQHMNLTSRNATSGNWLELESVTAVEVLAYGLSTSRTLFPARG